MGWSTGVLQRPVLAKSRRAGDLSAMYGRLGIAEILHRPTQAPCTPILPFSIICHLS